MNTKTLCEKIEQRKDELFSLLSDLIKINSENFGTYGNEAECAEYIHKFCLELGLESDIFSPLDLEGFTEHPDYMAGGSGTNIKGEFLQNGFAQNKLSHQRGVVSMARSMNPNSASSQFFICYGDCSFLDGQYAAFGKVVEGMETVDDFLKIERRGPEGGTPVETIRMKKVTVL